MNHRRSTENDRGGIALLASLVLMVMIGMGALVIDGGYLAMRRRNMQAVADAAALAGSVKLPTSATAISDARANATQNGYTDGAAGVTVTVNSPYLANANAIEVIVTKNVSTFLGKALKINTGLVTGRAVVKSNPAMDLIFANGANGCVVAACGTDLCINGSNINIQGSVHSNGSLTMNGDATDSIPEAWSMEAAVQPTTFPALHRRLRRHRPRRSLFHFRSLWRPSAPARGPTASTSPTETYRCRGVGGRRVAGRMRET